MTGQLALDLGPPPPPSFENFVPGANGEACDALRRIAGGDRRDRFVYLWGTPGSGRSHLLQAARRAAGGHGQVSRALCPLAALDAFGFDPAVRLWTLDDCDGLDATRQQAGFHLFNAIQANPRAALLAGGSAARGFA